MKNKQEPLKNNALWYLEIKTKKKKKDMVAMEERMCVAICLICLYMLAMSTWRKENICCHMPNQSL